jgi:hypothetical protein
MVPAVHYCKRLENPDTATDARNLAAALMALLNNYSARER